MNFVKETVNIFIETQTLQMTHLPQPAIYLSFSFRQELL